MVTRIKAKVQRMLQASGLEIRRATPYVDGRKGRMVLARIPPRPLEKKEDRAALNRLFASPNFSNVVLIVSHKEKQCGVKQYGDNISQALAKSQKYSFVYVECSNVNELNRAILENKPRVIIYNYIGSTMPWLENKESRGYEIIEIGIFHEVTQREADEIDNSFFDYYLCPDPTLIESNDIVIKTPRLIPEYINKMSEPTIPIIGSFGFGFSDKGFERLIEIVQSEFDEAKIVLRMPFNDIVDPEGRDHAFATAERCRSIITKPKIELEIHHDFLSKADLLDFLASNTLNAFLYTIEKERGISSTIEYALAVGRPIAVSRCNMFRHVHSADPSICIEDASLKQIIENGTAPLERFYTRWNEKNFILAYEEILDKVIGGVTIH